MSARDDLHDAILSILGGGDGGSRNDWAAHRLAGLSEAEKIALARAVEVGK